MLPSGTTQIGEIVRVLFQTAADQRLFSTARLIDQRFGVLVSKKIQLRLLLLKAVPSLAMVTQHPPICLRRVATSEFTLDLVAPSVLKISANAESSNLHLVEAITVLGVSP